MTTTMKRGIVKYSEVHKCCSFDYGMLKGPTFDQHLFHHATSMLPNLSLVIGYCGSLRMKHSVRFVDISTKRLEGRGKERKTSQTHHYSAQSGTTAKIFLIRTARNNCQR